MAVKIATGFNVMIAIPAAATPTATVEMVAIPNEWI